MSKKEILKRYLIFTAGLFFSALGIAFTKQGDLGMSTVSSAPYVMSMQFDSISFGMWSTISNCTFVLLQIIILRKNFKPIQLLQIPFSFLFGYFTDFGVWLISPIPVSNYLMQMLMVLIGIAVLSFGITLAVIADVMYNSGEGLVKAISDVSGFKFGNVKVAFDISVVALAVVLSLLFFGEVRGVREGTIISAILTGFTVKLMTKPLSKPLNSILTR